MTIAKGTTLDQVDVLSAEGSLFHYTTAPALTNIVSTSEFWVTHASFLNDYAEIAYITDVAREASFGLAGSRELAVSFSEALTERFIALRERFLQMYVLSFSTRFDSLTLWSEFSGGEGYFVEIGAEDFRSHINVQVPGFRYFTEGRVVYDRERQVSIVCDEVLTPWLRSVGVASVDEVDMDSPFLQMLAMSLFEYAPFFKDPLFASEDEYRFVFHFREAVGGKPPCSFRTRGQNVIPFVRVSLASEDGEKLPLRRIVAGPKNSSDLALSGIRYLLQCNDYQGVDVVRSQVTLRY